MVRIILNSSRAITISTIGVGSLLGIASFNGFAQDSGSSPAESARVLSIVPRVSVTETLTNNATLTSVGRRSDQITEISPGIQISSDQGRVKGFIDYSLRNLVFTQNSSSSNSQNALNAFGTIEAVSNWAYLDFNGTIAQQAISAFGTQAPSNLNSNVNRTESKTFRLSPHVRGRLASFADYDARYSVTTNRNGSSVASDVTTNEAVVRVRGQSTSARLGWSLDASSQTIRYSRGRMTDADSVNGNLTYSINPQLNLSLLAGREVNNYITINKKSSFKSGFGFNWTPSETTRFSASRQNRSFGSSHSVFFEHRTARTAWRFNDSKDVSATPSQNGAGSRGSVYDLAFSQFATQEPDPVLRASLVNDFLRINGLNPNETVVSSFLTSAVSLQRRQELSFVLLGVRDTVTLSANRSEGLRLDSIVSGVNDDLSNFTAVRQTGLSLGYAHRLTPETSLNVVGSAQKSSDSQGLQRTSTKSVNVSVSTRVGAQATAALGVRRVVFESPAVPYTESAVTGTLNVQF